MLTIADIARADIFLMSPCKQILLWFLLQIFEKNKYYYQGKWRTPIGSAGIGMLSVMASSISALVGMDLSYSIGRM
jgi:hypothetical protein